MRGCVSSTFNSKWKHYICICLKNDDINGHLALCVSISNLALKLTLIAKYVQPNGCELYWYVAQKTSTEKVGSDGNVAVYKCSKTWWIHTSMYKDCERKNESSHVGLQNIRLDIMRTYCVVTQMSNVGRRAVRQACMHVPVCLNIDWSLHMTPQNKIVTRAIWFIMFAYQDRRTPDINQLVAIKYPTKWFLHYPIELYYCLSITYDHLICAWFYGPRAEDCGQTTTTSLHCFSPPTSPSLTCLWHFTRLQADWLEVNLGDDRQQPLSVTCTPQGCCSED